MEAEGLRSMFPMERLSVMGFVEPLKRLPELLRIRHTVFEHFRDNPPDLFLGIDSPDFNLRLERKLRQCNIRTAHLVSPSVWAWRQGRIKKIKKSVDLMLCLFPFELEVYRDNGVPAEFVGHPLADELPTRLDPACARQALQLPQQGRLLALLPGSRGAEVSRLAPVLLGAARLLWQQDPGLKFVLPAANAARERELCELLAEQPDLPITLISGRSREAMAAADAVLLASGTATLEAALVKRPMVVTYRMAAFSWWLVTKLVRISFAALPNVLAGRSLVPELLQDAATPEAAAAAVAPLLSGEASGEQLQAFDRIHEQLRQGYARKTALALQALARGDGAGHG